MVREHQQSSARLIVMFSFCVSVFQPVTATRPARRSHTTDTQLSWFHQTVSRFLCPQAVPSLLRVLCAKLGLWLSYSLIGYSGGGWAYLNPSIQGLPLIWALVTGEVAGELFQTSLSPATVSQLFVVDPEAFPGLMGCVVPPMTSGSTLWSPPGSGCPVTSSGRHKEDPDSMPELIL